MTDPSLLPNRQEKKEKGEKKNAKYRAGGVFVRTWFLDEGVRVRTAPLKVRIGVRTRKGLFACCLRYSVRTHRAIFVPLFVPVEFELVAVFRLLLWLFEFELEFEKVRLGSGF